MMEPELDQKKFSHCIPAWHHVECFLDNLSSLEAEGVGPESLSGFTKLKTEDKDGLKKQFVSKVGHIKG